jgi:hypothetical protein
VITLACDVASHVEPLRLRHLRSAPVAAISVEGTERGGIRTGWAKAGLHTRIALNRRADHDAGFDLKHAVLVLPERRPGDAALSNPAKLRD